MKLLSIIAMSTSLMLFVISSTTADTTTVVVEERKKQRKSFFPPYPQRNDMPKHSVSPALRYENITDIEVREIQSVAKQINPGAIVNIGGVIEGCPCEDGADCKNQVWVVSHTSDKSSGVMYSKINDYWKIGPVQSWWLKYEALIGKWDNPKRWRKPRDWYEKHELEFRALYESMPYCSLDEIE